MQTGLIPILSERQEIGCLLLSVLDRNVSNPLISLPNLAAYHSLAEIFSLALLNAHGTYLY